MADDAYEFDPRDQVPRSPFPDQPLVMDGKVVRFMRNRIVEDLIALGQEHGFGLNEIAMAGAQGKYTQAEQAQLSQLDGYSVSGFGDLSFVNYDDLQRADEAVEEFTKDPVTKLGDTVRRE
jgi:hypothetical protein